MCERCDAGVVQLELEHDDAGVGGHETEDTDEDKARDETDGGKDGREETMLREMVSAIMIVGALARIHSERVMFPYSWPLSTSRECCRQSCPLPGPRHR